MSLKIIKGGLLDTVQDRGRYGYGHQGINPGGAMDRFSACLANALLGKELNAPVIEMHFPAAQIVFQKAAFICLAGADFKATIDTREVPLHQPLAVAQGSVLKFMHKRKGARCYLAILNEMELEPWLNSYSTNLKAGVGGYKGKRLESGDEISFAEIELTIGKEAISLPWKYKAVEHSSNNMEFIPGPEWDWITTESQTLFLNHAFTITPSSDRMGYRLEGEALEAAQKEQLVSSAVTFGTVQLLPNGNLIILMADHQTTGGYPRIATVVSAHLPRLAQKVPGEDIQFVMTNVETAAEKWIAQQKSLHSLQNTCKLKLQNWANANRH